MVAEPSGGCLGTSRKGNCGAAPDGVCRDGVEAAADETADERHELREVDDALASSFGQETDADQFVDLDQDLAGNPRDRRDGNLLSDRDSDALEDLLARVAQHAEQDGRLNAVIGRVVPAD